MSDTEQLHDWGNQAVAQNIGFNFTTPSAMVTGWMNSPGHKANILEPGTKRVGTGVALNAKGELYIAAVFATLATDPE